MTMAQLSVDTTSNGLTHGREVNIVQQSKKGEKITFNKCVFCHFPTEYHRAEFAVSIYTPSEMYDLA